MSDRAPIRPSRVLEESLHAIALAPPSPTDARALAAALAAVGHGLARGVDLPEGVRAWLRALEPDATSAAVREAWGAAPPCDDEGHPVDREAARRGLVRAFAPDRWTATLRATLRELRPTESGGEPVESGAPASGGPTLLAGAALTDHVMTAFVTREAGAEDVESLAACRPAVAEEVLASVEAIAALGEPLSDEARVWAATRTPSPPEAASPADSVVAPVAASRSRVSPWLAIAASVALAFGAGAVVKKQGSDEEARSEAARAAELESVRAESARSAEVRRQSGLTAAMEGQRGSTGGARVGDADVGATGNFDHDAAARALADVPLDACRQDGGPTGEGHVAITFEPDGSVRSVLVDAAPYAGTSVGECLAQRFRAVRVPAFGGAPVKVGKRFSIR